MSVLEFTEAHFLDPAWIPKTISMVPSTHTIASIQQVVADHFGITVATMLSKSRIASTAYARSIAMYVCKKRIRCSYEQIGFRFGGRHHATTRDAVRKIAHQAENDSQLHMTLVAIEHALELA